MIYYYTTEIAIGPKKKIMDIPDEYIRFYG